jgi:hypothetical protein
MAITLKSVGQLLAEGATLAAIDIGASNAADKYARAQVALQVAAAFTSIAAGDLAGALATAQAALLAKVTDPGQVALIQGLFTIGNAQIQVVSQATTVIPLLSATAQGVAAEVAAGITAIASTYVTPQGPAAK